MTDRALLQQALEALELLSRLPTDNALDYASNAIDALKEKLAQPEQEPVACRFCGDDRGCWAWQCNHCGEIDDAQEPAPPQRKPDHIVDATKMVLTDEEIKQIELSLRQYNKRDTYDLSLKDFARAIEARLKEKNQ